MKGESRRRIGVADLCLLCLLLLALLGGGLRLWSRLHAEVPAKDARVLQLRVRGMPVEGSLCLTTGEALYFEDGRRFGSLVAFAMEGRVLSQLSNGVYTTGEDPVGRVCELSLSARVRGSACEDCFLLESERPIRLGQVLVLYTKRACLVAEVVSIESVRSAN